MNGQSNFYTVKKGDTLGKIAKENGTTFESLKKINGLKNAHRIDIGQRIALRPEAVCGIGALFLDRDRNSIKDLVYRIERCGKIFNGITGENGKTKSLLTETPDDPVKIWVKRLDGSWKLVTTVASGFGNKLVTLISGHMMVQATTEKHPILPPNTKPNPKDRQKPIHGKPPSPTMDKKELGLKVTPVKTQNGKPLTKVEGDIPTLDFLDATPDLTGLTEADFIYAAKALDVSPAHIKTVTEVEARGIFFWELKKTKRNVLPILFERHKFSWHSGHKFDDKYPDISARKYGGYVGGTSEYKRIVRAVQLDREAALKSASWGAFQILGEHYAALGFTTAEEFVKFVSHSAKNQLNIFVKACDKVNPVWGKALRSKDWVKFAKSYNGAAYKRNNYDEKLKTTYERLTKDMK